MSHWIAYRPLREDEIETLERQGCSAEDWSQVEVADGFRPERVRRSHFCGRMRIGSLSGSVESAGGVRKQSGIENAYLADCTIGNEVRIANVGVHVANYAIGDGASIEDIGAIEANPGATFGNGVEIAVLNEAGGREVLLFNELSSQIAYLMCVHRYRPRLIEKLRGFVEDYVERVQSDHGTIGAGATVRSVREMRDVAIGEHAVVHGAASLVDGTVLSSRVAPTTVGADVQAEHFIIAEVGVPYSAT